MKITTLRSTPSPEDLMIEAARNDYMTDSVVDYSIDELIEQSGSDTRQEFIERLLERGHFGPLEHASITFSVEKTSRVCMAQITRHRQASFDVQSMRYTAPGADVKLDRDNIGEYFVIPPVTPGNTGLILRESALGSFWTYQQLLEEGMNKEDARFALPLGTAVNIVFTINARTLLHIQDLRNAGDAQWEAQDLAKGILREARDWSPIVMDYYEREMNKRKNRLAP